MQEFQNDTILQRSPENTEEYFTLEQLGKF